jgi:hypothetical protein
MPEDNTADESVEPTAGDMAAEAPDHEAGQRHLLKALTSLLALRSHDSDPSDRVQLAFDLMHIAACERVSRIVRADLTGDQG